MVKGKQITYKAVDKPVVNYRKLDALNQSMLKKFDSDPVAFFEEFKLGKTKKDKPSIAKTIGNLADFYLLECRGDEQEFENRFDEQFALFNGVKGSGQVFVLVDYLFEATLNSLDENGKIGLSFEERFKEAFDKIKAEDKYKGKDMIKVLEDFDKNGKDYFQTLIDNIGKTVVDVPLIDKGKFVANLVLTDPFTRDLFAYYEGVEVHTHFPIEWKHYLNTTQFIRCKAEVDRLEIDHNNKIIQPDDLKTNYDNEEFHYGYIKNSYYLQNAFYYLGVQKWAQENNLGDYLVKPMRFIVGDTSANNRRPLIYQTSMDDIYAGLNGFKLRGREYRGVFELIRDIIWAEENDQWRCSKKAFDNHGKMQLKIDYDTL